MRVETWFATVVALTIGSGAGCGTDPRSNVPVVQSQTSPASASGSSAGRNASGASAAGGRPAATAGVGCGSTTCMQVFPGAPEPCCADPAKGVCSAIDATGQCAPPPMLDARCPSVKVPIGNAEAKGCCTEQGMCGTDASVAGMGCVDLASPMFRMFVPDAPAPRRCDESSPAAAAAGSTASTGAGGATAAAAGSGASAGMSGNAAAAAVGGKGAAATSAGAGGVAQAPGGKCPDGFVCTMVPVAGNVCSRTGETMSPSCTGQDECSALLAGATCMMVFNMSFCSLACTP